MSSWLTVIFRRKCYSRTSVCVSVTNGLIATFSLYSCGLMSKICISGNAYVINVKLAFEEGSLIKELKFKRKRWFQREYGLVVMHWAGARIGIRRETEPGATTEVQLGSGCKRNPVLLFI